MRKLPSDQAWYLIASPARRDDPSFGAFRDWLLGQANEPRAARLD